MNTNVLADHSTLLHTIYNYPMEFIVTACCDNYYSNNINIWKDQLFIHLYRAWHCTGWMIDNGHRRQEDVVSCLACELSSCIRLATNEMLNLETDWLIDWLDLYPAFQSNMDTQEGPHETISCTTIQYILRH